jgi:hypothetical protein
VVRDWLQPALEADDLLDQCTFMPMGSTECALINCTEFAMRMFDLNENVRCMLTDFTKAFDMVDQATVIMKFNTLNTSASIKKLDNFLSYWTVADDQDQ